VNLRKDHYRTYSTCRSRTATTTSNERTRKSLASTGRRRCPTSQGKDGDRQQQLFRTRSTRRNGISADVYRCRRRGYLSRRLCRPFVGDGGGESVCGRRSSSGIRCPAASHAVAVARFKEPPHSLSLVRSADERRPPRRRFFSLFTTLNVVNVSSVESSRRRRLASLEDEL
jgi:hypothetical protein